jgi:hypothetical protein
MTHNQVLFCFLASSEIGNTAPVTEVFTLTQEEFDSHPAHGTNLMLFSYTDRSSCYMHHYMAHALSQKPMPGFNAYGTIS